MATAAAWHQRYFSSLISDPHIQTDSDSNSSSHREDLGFRFGHSETHAWHESLIEHLLISDHPIVEESLSTKTLSYLDQIYLAGLFPSLLRSSLLADTPWGCLGRL